MHTESDLGDYTSNFPCFLCGECCSRYQARISLSEARCISENLGLEWRGFLKNYTDSKWPGEQSFLLRHKNGACIFLKRPVGKRITTCLIHSFKPDSCVQWTPGPYRRECRDGLKRLWGLNIGEDGRATGDSKDLTRFNNFLHVLYSEAPEPQE